ncbi:McrC family protein [Bacillus testis]|uniref:McrC family protein n=1 Tax=Bacillus testis TaxID=1622072 RepID=UPI00067E810B|nr:hypothetical protein [Bacillus testis]
MKTQYILSEYSDDIILPDYELTVEEREYLTEISIVNESRPWEKRFYFDELRNGLRIRTQSWVGVIELDQARIIIQPKFNKGFTSLTEMMAFAEEWPLYRKQYTSGELESTNLLEILVRLFLQEVDLIIGRGFFKEYVTERNNLRQIRGKVDFRRNMKHNFNLPVRVYCEYDEFVTNIVENQVLLTVLSTVSRLPLQKDTKQQLNILRSQLEQICQEYKGTNWPSFHYHRLNAHYEQAHKLGEYLWKRLSASTFFERHTFYYSFLIDMNELFEKFIVQLLRKYLPRTYKVHHGKRVTKAILCNGDSYRYIIPDIVVENKQIRQMVVLDVKYKQYGKRKVENSDIYQLAFYAQYYSNGHNEDYGASIIYPKYKEDLIQENSLLLNGGTSYQGILHIKAVSIEEVLYAVAKRDLKWLGSVALNIVGRK